MRELLDQLLAGRALSAEQACALVVTLGTTDVEPALAGAILAALRLRGETSDEVAGFAQGLAGLALRPEIEPGAARDAVDIVGTGGDGSNTFNLSTGAAILTAAAGLSVIKHGNRAVTSSSGSADVLGALGLPMPMDPTLAGRCLRETNFTFLFAPHYHPAFARLAPIRKALGVRTIFNMLGPLTNPARPAFAVVGAYSLGAAQTMAGALAQMHTRRAIVLHARDGSDEPTPACEFDSFDVTPGRVVPGTLTPEDFGVPRTTREQLRGGDGAHNARALTLVLTGADTGPHLHALLMGAALALWCAGRVSSVRAGADAAYAAITDGRAATLLDKLKRLGAGV